MAATTVTSASATVITSFPLNPLTTTFTPPAPCTGIYWSNVGIVGGMSSCQPSGFGLSATNYFSPGIACPAGYYTACHDTQGVSSITTVTCCPIRDSITLSCVDPSTLSSIWENLFCTWIAPQSGAAVPMTLSAEGTTSTILSTMTSPEGINAYGIRMVHQATDLATTTATTTQTAGGGGGGGGAAGGIQSGVPSLTPSPAPSDAQSMSTGAIVAVAVVVPVVVLSLLAALFFWLWKKRKRTSQVPELGAGLSPQQQQLLLQQPPPGQLGSYVYGSEAKPAAHWEAAHPNASPVELPLSHVSAAELPTEIHRQGANR